MLPVTPTDFTPWLSLGGGVLIGLSAVMVMALFGRIAGIVGITAGAVAQGDRRWRIAFIGGLLAAPLVWLLATGAAPVQTVSDNLGGMALAGLLVGVGTSLGSGCTSGHGVCGLARLSGRSLAAVVTFMVFAALAVFVLRHLVGGAV
ncbi:YeeE/YedE family protein [Jannaschia rubra]|uniref:YeeE/YedE family protein n=1 Tax=Jannaschia rubra TaxID=282197 RepID=UPI002490893C|nr:YeeE/YedE family protein [Jannaschia rubra]